MPPVISILLSTVADIVGVHWKTVQVWVIKFRKLGLSS
jgi:transposase